MKNLLMVALVASPLVACSGAVESGAPADENVSSSESELSVVPAPFPTSYLIDFDRDPSGTAIASGSIMDTTYTSMGVTLSGIKCTPGMGCVTAHAYAQSSVLPESAPNVVSQDALDTIFEARYGAVRADFATARSWVSIDVMPVLTAADWIVPPTSQPWLEAYDANNTMIGRMYYPISYGSANWGSYQTLRVDAGSARIKWVRFSVQPPGTNTAEVFGSFDNLRFNSDYIRRLCLPNVPC